MTESKGEERDARNVSIFMQKTARRETLEMFHSVLSGLAASCDLGALERRTLRDAFKVSMSNKEAQTELCRSIKTPKEIYRIALLYERDDKYAKIYKVSDRGLSAVQAGALQIKMEPIKAVRGSYRRPFQRGGRGALRGNNQDGADRKCFNCDQSGCTPDHIARCPAKKNYLRGARRKEKTGQHQHTCRDRSGAGRGRVDLIHEDGNKGDPQQDQDDTAFHYGSSVGWVNDPNDEVHG